MKLNKKVKQKWCDALRSGKYKQGRTFLKIKETGDTEYKYCCLGVLCEILKSKLDLVERDSLYTVGLSSKFNESNTGLPEVVRDFTGISEYGDFGDDESLASYNDGGEYTFDQIATIIEEKF